MNILQFHEIIEQDIQNMGFFTHADLTHEEIDLQINRQIYILLNGILDKHFGRALKIGPEQGFQSEQVTLDNLRTLTVKDNYYQGVVNVNDPLEVIVPLPPGYYHLIRVTGNIAFDCYENGKKVTKSKVVGIRIVPSQSHLRENPFHKTGKDSLLGEIADTNLYVLQDTGFRVTGALFTFIRIPAVVKYAEDIDGNYDVGSSTQCDLDLSLHHMIQKMTSIEIMQTLESSQQKIVNFKQDIQ